MAHETIHIIYACQDLDALHYVHKKPVEYFWMSQ